MTEAEKYLNDCGFDPTKMNYCVYDEDYSMEDLKKHCGIESFEVRQNFIAKFGFAVLSDAAVEWLRPYCPMVEIGAGSGYWSYELQVAGLDVIATEPYQGRPGYRHKGWKMWTKAEPLDGKAAAIKYPDRTLLMVWPDCSGHWSSDTLKAYTGKRVIYVGEGNGGCTGDERYHAILEKDFGLTESFRIPNFFGIHDRVMVYERLYPLPGEHE